MISIRFQHRRLPAYHNSSGPPSLLYVHTLACCASCILDLVSNVLSMYRTSLRPPLPLVSGCLAENRFTVATGIECTVCASGYGRGAASACHLCNESFKVGMYSILAVATLLALIVMALLVVYLVRKQGWSRYGDERTLDCLSYYSSREELGAFHEPGAY